MFWTRIHSTKNSGTYIQANLNEGRTLPDMYISTSTHIYLYTCWRIRTYSSVLASSPDIVEHVLSPCRELQRVSTGVEHQILHCKFLGIYHERALFPSEAESLLHHETRSWRRRRWRTKWGKEFSARLFFLSLLSRTEYAGACKPYMEIWAETLFVMKELYTTPIIEFEIHPCDWP